MAREDEKIVIGADTGPAERELSKFAGKAVSELGKIKNATRLNLLANLAQLRSFVSTATSMMMRFSRDTLVTQERAERQLRYALDQTKRYSEEVERSLLDAAKRVSQATTLSDEAAIKLMATLARVPEVPLDSLEQMAVAIMGFANLTADSAEEANSMAVGIAEQFLTNLEGMAEGYGDAAGLFTEANAKILEGLAETGDAGLLVEAAVAAFTDQFHEMGEAVEGSADKLTQWKNTAADTIQELGQAGFEAAIDPVTAAVEGAQAGVGTLLEGVLSRVPERGRGESPAPAGRFRGRGRGRGGAGGAERDAEREERDRLRAITEAERGEARMETLREELAGVEEIHRNHNERMRELEVMENEARRELEAGFNEARNEQLLEEYELEREVQLQRYETEKADLQAKLDEEAALADAARLKEAAKRDKDAKERAKKEKEEAKRAKQRKLQAVHDALTIEAHGHKGLAKIAKLATIARLGVSLATEPREAYAKTMAAFPGPFAKPLAIAAAATTAASLLAALAAVGGSGGGSGGADDPSAGGLGSMRTGRVGGGGELDDEPEEEEGVTEIHLTVELEGDTLAQTVERVVRHASDNE